MSLVNVWLTRDRALIGVDTGAALLGGPLGHVSKLLPLSHLNAILTGLGHIHFINSLFAGLQMANVPSFDALLQIVPRVLPEVFDGWAGYVATLERCDPAELERQRVVLVGWSTAEGRPIGREFAQETRAVGWVCDPIEPYYIMPWHDSLSGLPDPVNAVALTTLARAQVALLRRVEPGSPIGGRLIVAQLTRGGVSMGSVCNLEDAGAVPEV